MPKTVETPDGDKVTIHDHHWVQYKVELTTGPQADKAGTGCVAHWRCTRPRCDEWVTKKYLFRKPGRTQLGNSYSPNLSKHLRVATLDG